MHQDDDKPRIPRVIRSADGVFNAWPAIKRPVGYSPALGVQMAGAHCWAPYAEVASALRSLALLGGLGENQGSRKAAREILRDLFLHPAPFGANVRFPADQVFLSVDHGVFGQCVYQILTELQRVEAAAGTASQHHMVDACEAFVKAVASAAAALERPEVRATPVLYDRLCFQGAFGLTWTEP